MPRAKQEPIIGDEVSIEVAHGGKKCTGLAAASWTGDHDAGPVYHAGRGSEP
jgi:hypothetical protein